MGDLISFERAREDPEALWELLRMGEIRKFNLRRPPAEYAAFREMPAAVVNFSGKVCHEGRWHEAVLSGISFSGADLTGTAFCGANCIFTDFRETKLLRASFEGAMLTRVNFQGADLRGADFSGALIWEVDLSGANIFGVVGLSKAMRCRYISHLQASWNG
jgi:uncharacterized protein YjbI with pentapeptide repeats